MPNGRNPKSQDDKEWKLEVDRELGELRRELNLLKVQLAAFMRRG